MAKRLGKGVGFISLKTVFERPLSFFAMWNFMLLYCVYFTVISAQTEMCPDSCHCSGNIVKCVGRKLLRIPKWLPKNVTNLDLSGNSLSSFGNNTFLEFSNLIELNLNDNNITDVENLGRFPDSLQVLYLNRNRIKILNGDWSRFIKLDFSQNKIESIGNETLLGVSNLKELRLNGNNLAHLPNIHCPSLRMLDLSYNKLRTVESFKFSKMVPTVEILKLSNNKIKFLQTAAFHGLQVKHLYLNGNFLESIKRDWLFGLKTLEYLYVENNKIVNISSSTWKAMCCSNLKYINLAHNNLKGVLFNDDKNYGGHFANLDMLVTLNLSANHIFDISDGAFRSLRQLRILDLSNNQISRVKKLTFEKVPTLEKLDMRNNPIVEVLKDAFSSLKNLRDLWMNSDVVYCTCKLRWFSKWIRIKRFARSIAFKCNQPSKLLGVDFTTIPTKDLLCDSSHPEIIKHPESQIAMKGGEVRLSCTVKNGSNQGIQILWQKNMKNMTESEGRIHTQVQDNSVYYESILYLSHVTNDKDGGVYQCIVLVRKGQIASRIARLRVFVPPKFTSTPGDLVTNLGDDVSFNCSASGHPQPTISFRKEKTLRLKAVLEGRVGLGTNGDTFIIRNISRGDVGLYRCFAESEAGVVNATFTLNVIGKPVPVHEMLDKVALLNDAVVFVCAANGWPRPKYTWFKDGILLDLTSNKLQLHLEHNAEHLVILHAGYSDAGEYKCRVSNVLGYVELSSQLKVVKDLSEKPPTPSDDDDVNHKTFIGAVIFTAACTMVLTTLVCVAVFHAITRRGCTCWRKTSETVTLDSFVTTVPENPEYVQMTENFQNENFQNESPRSSSTFVTSSDSQPHSDLQTSSSESGSSKEHREGSYDGRHSSGVCSMNSSTSSLASTTNHRNTFPFSNTKTYLYPGPEPGSCDVSNDVMRGYPGPIQPKHNDPGRRKHKSSPGKPSRSRGRHMNKGHRADKHERLHEPQLVVSTTDEYRTESEGTVL